MKKVFAGLVILLSAVLCLSGCEDNKIDDGLEKQVTEKGKEMMQAWVDENMPGPRPQLEVTADLRLPEDTDLFAYNLAGVKSLCEECGGFFHNLDLATEDQEFSSLWFRETTTYERGWIDQDDFRLRRIPAGGVNGGQDVLTAVQLSLITRRWGTITLFAGRSG